MLTLPTSADAPLLLHGDCLDLLADLPDACIDVVITDPPAGIGFMAKPWDSFAGYKPRTGPGRDIEARLDGLFAPWAVGFVVFMTDVWAEVDRVLKPGGFVCAWALPKTADLAGLALRAVGWEMHDSLLHLFGGGMKKGIDVGKAIDGMYGVSREAVAKVARPRGTKDNTAALGGSWQDAPDITVPSTDDAKRWDGWHSQLAPGHECWLLARKPTRLTYAKQVLAFGTGALHVDACRIPRGEAITTHSRGKSTASGCRPGETTVEESGRSKPQGVKGFSERCGSWPRNVLITCGGSECPAAELDRQSGTLTSGTDARRNETAAGHQGSVYGVGSQPVGTMQVSHGDSGGASRFFTRFDDRVWYGGKAHRRDIPGSSRTIKHPTHKNPELMDWLTRLLAATAEQTGDLPAVTLDPFMGSGTGAVSALRAGIRYVGFELDADSHETAVARVSAARGDPEAAAAANVQAQAGAQLGLL